MYTSSLTALILSSAFLCCAQQPRPAEKPACDDGDSCTRLALAYEDGKGVAMNLAAAAHYYKRGCDLGSAHSCGSLGVLRFYGHGVSPDIALGLSLLSRSCDGDYGQACSNLGVIYALGRGVQKDEARGAAYFARGCARGSALGCDGAVRLNK